MVIQRPQVAKCGHCGRTSVPCCSYCGKCSVCDSHFGCKKTKVRKRCKNCGVLLEKHATQCQTCKKWVYR